MQPRTFTGRTLSALLLAVLLAAAIYESSPSAAGQPAKKDKEKKDKDKEPPKQPEFKWPTHINGKDLKEVMKDMENRDPTIREFAARTLPSFGPPAQKGEVSKLILHRAEVEKDPGVKAAVFNSLGQIQFDDERDNQEAFRLLNIALLTPGQLRLQAIQSIAMFGPKGYGSITRLSQLADPSYEVRRNIANALGRVGFSDTTGPNMVALRALANRFATDPSAAVRTEALQALLVLGPPWGVVRKKPEDKTPVKIDAEQAAIIVTYMRARIGNPKLKMPAQEKDKQVEIWARLVLMRFDPREVNEENLDAFAQHLTGDEMGVKLQALQAIALMGEAAGKTVNAVVHVMNEKDSPFQLTVTSINVLMAMGAGAKPAIPDLKKLAEAKRKDRDKRIEGLVKKPDDPQLKGEKAALEELIKLIEAAIKRIDEAKLTSPSVEPKDPPKKK